MLLFATGIAALVVACAVGYYAWGTLTLQSILESHTWTRYDDGLELTLKFRNGVIDYDASMSTYFFGRQTYDIASLEYRVTAPDRIEVRGVASGADWESIATTADDRRASFSPSFVDRSTYSSWYAD